MCARVVGEAPREPGRRAVGDLRTLEDRCRDGEESPSAVRLPLINRTNRVGPFRV
jgi:hypothetical protein